MGSLSQNNDNKDATDANTISVPDIAIGSSEQVVEHVRLPWTWQRFFRSVLLQMVLFGM